ncbi:copper resistance CopC/CopD family protein [Paenisporosarcina quisquiliarum]|uniref:copper resistance CopC/CopD family protein n=1 Tax=Paenisporosarcina quisquiliarum TaxID=365346 RepID=UPI003736638F
MRQCSIFFVLVFSLFAYTLTASAHADLSSSSPAQGDVLETMPNEVCLSFTTSIDPTVFELDVRTQGGGSILKGDAKINSNKNELSAALIPDASGQIQIIYSVISKDGHPIKGVIDFSVNKAGVVEEIETPTKEEVMTEEKISNEDMNMTLVSEEKLSINDTEQMTSSVSTLSAIIKFMYITSLLLLSGLLIWKSRGFQTRFIPASQLLHLALLFLFTWSQARDFLTVFDHLTWGDLFLRTEVGQYWTAALVVTVIGLYVVGRNRSIDLSFVALLLLLKSLNSHAVASDFPCVTIGLNFIHLGLAAVWIGGIFILLTLWKQGEANTFLPVFSRAALFSILALSVTGTIYALILAPSIDALWTTTWGYWLSAKIVTVFGVFIVGGFIRRNMRINNDFTNKKFLYFDSGLAILILLIVGVLTQLSPS